MNVSGVQGVGKATGLKKKGPFQSSSSLKKRIGKANEASPSEESECHCEALDGPEPPRDCEDLCEVTRLSGNGWEW